MSNTERNARVLGLAGTHDVFDIESGPAWDNDNRLVSFGTVLVGDERIDVRRDGRDGPWRTEPC